MSEQFEKEGTILEINKENSGIKLEEMPKVFIYSKKEDREEILKKIKDLERGDKISITGFTFNNINIYTDVNLIEKGDALPKIPEERVKNPEERTAYISPEENEKRDYWEKKKIDDREYDRKKFLEMAKLNSMNNSTMIINAMIESKSITITDLKEYQKFRNMEMRDIFRILTGEDWNE